MIRTRIHGTTKHTTLSCDNAECGHGFEYQTPTDLEVPVEHTDEIVRAKAAEGGWGMRGELDLCRVCAPIWMPEDGSTPPRPLPVGKEDRPEPKRVEYPHGHGFSHRAPGVTKTTQE